MEWEEVIDAMRPFALALKSAREVLGPYADMNDVTALACRRASYDDFKQALATYNRLQSQQGGID